MRNRLLVLILLIVLDVYVFANGDKKELFQWDTIYSNSNIYRFTGDKFYMFYYNPEDEIERYYLSAEFEDGLLVDVKRNVNGDIRLPAILKKQSWAYVVGENVEYGQKPLGADFTFQLTENYPYNRDFANYYHIRINNINETYLLENVYCDNASANILYIDCLNNKIYFRGVIQDVGKGIIVYDAKQRKSEIILKDEDDLRYLGYLNGYCKPVRIPNSPYLLYQQFKAVGQEQAIDRYIIKIFIEEISEWKVEIEQQKNNEKLYPNIKKYFIDGPANIKDTPKGKNTVMLNDWTEVLVLNQQGDWYEILYANVRGWTYKDNLRIGSK